MDAGLQLLGRHKTGTEFAADISLGTASLDEKQVVIAFVRDVSERKRAEATSRDLRAQVRMVVELKRLLTVERAAVTEAETAQSALVVRLDQMEEVDRLKDDSIAVVTHELRTPLTAVLGYSQTLLAGEAGPLSDMQQHFLSVIERNSRRLVRIVDDLLFVARVESGVLDLSVEPVDLGVLVEEVIDGARTVADSNGVSLELRAAPLPEFSGDPARLSELVENLLANALKYTPKGGSIVVDLGGSNSHVVLEIADTGIGIPVDEQPHLFDRFYRATSAIEHQIQGTGLGLTIVKMIVEAHGGDIVVESAEGAGTTVRIELPVHDPVPLLRGEKPRELGAKR